MANPTDVTLTDCNFAISNYNEAASKFAAIPQPFVESCLQYLSKATSAISEGRTTSDKLTAAVADFTTAEKKVTTLQTDVSNVNPASINQSISKYQQMIDAAITLQSKPGRTAADMQAFNTQIIQLKTIIADLKEQLKSVEGKLTTLKEQLGLAKNEMELAQGNMNKYYGLLNGTGVAGGAGYTSKINTNIDEYNACIAKLSNSTVSGSVSSGSVSSGLVSSGSVSSGSVSSGSVST